MHVRKVQRRDQDSNCSVTNSNPRSLSNSDPVKSFLFSYNFVIKRKIEGANEKLSGAVAIKYTYVLTKYTSKVHHICEFNSGFNATFIKLC